MNSGLSSKNDVIVQMAYLLGQRIAMQRKILSFIYLTFFCFLAYFNLYCWFSHDVTKIQTKKLSILPRFYFHDALEKLKTNFH